VREFGPEVHNATGNCLFHGILNSSVEAGDKQHRQMWCHIHKTNLKLREYFKAMHNTPTKIDGTNIRNFELKWHKADKYL
jgi:hypothetical protein